MLCALPINKHPKGHHRQGRHVQGWTPGDGTCVGGEEVLSGRVRRRRSWAGVLGAGRGGGLVWLQQGHTTNLLHLGHCRGLLVPPLASGLALLLEILLKPKLIGASAQHSPLASHQKKPKPL